MKGFQSWNGPELDVTSLSAEQLRDLQLRAMNFPTKKFGGHRVRSYLDSELRRVLTVVDSVVLLGIAVNAPTPMVALVSLFLLTLCVCNVTAGGLSITAYVTNVILDQVPADKPSAESLHVGSPESLALIADYLAKPSLHETEAFIVTCDRRLAPIDRLLEDTTTIESKLRLEAEKQTRSAVQPLYDRQISDAREMLQRLRVRKEEILRQRRLAEQELASIHLLLGDMHVLAHASYQLRVVQDRVHARTQEQDEDLSRRQVANICLQMQGTRERISALEGVAIARARAITEVSEMTKAS